MFRFTRDDNSIEDGFRRIAIEQVDKMLEDYEKAADDPALAIHDLRKRCKRLRSLLRLVGPEFSSYVAENAAIRDAAADLSITRDAQALVETFDHYIAPEDETEPKRFAHIRQSLVEDCEQVSGTGKDAVEDFAQAMKGLRDRADEWKLDATGFPALRKGLARTYEAGRAGMRKAHDKADPVIFHDWRKAVKYHGHHMALLRDLAPEILPTQRGLADQLGEVLGDHHNLSVLVDTLDKSPSRYGSPAQLETLAGVVERHSKALESQAFTIGRQLLAEKPEALVDRFQSYWKSWR